MYSTIPKDNQVQNWTGAVQGLSLEASDAITEESVIIEKINSQSGSEVWISVRTLSNQCNYLSET